MTASTPLSDSDYRIQTSAVLASIEATIDAWLEEDLVDIDGQRTGGLLEMRFPNGSVIVINTQPPLKELWLAARSGGYHYQFIDGHWLDTREGRDFFADLSAAATDQADVVLTFEPPRS